VNEQLLMAIEIALCGVARRCQHDRVAAVIQMRHICIVLLLLTWCAASDVIKDCKMTAYRGRVVSGGRLQIPADVRKELGLADGDSVSFEVIDGELRVRSTKSALARVRAIVQAHVPADVSLAEELLAERRAEAAHD